MRPSGSWIASPVQIRPAEEVVGRAVVRQAVDAGEVAVRCEQQAEQREQQSERADGSRGGQVGLDPRIARLEREHAAPGEPCHGHADRDDDQAEGHEARLRAEILEVERKPDRLLDHEHRDRGRADSGGQREETSTRSSSVRRRNTP